MTLRESIESEGSSAKPSTEERLRVREHLRIADDEFVETVPAIAKKANYLLEHTIHPTDDIESMFAKADQVQGANCHKTALYLTGHYSREQLFDPGNDDPATAGHHDIEELSTLHPGFDVQQPEPVLRNQIEQWLSAQQTPFRVSFFAERDGAPFAEHSIVILGKSNKGRLIGFDKAGPYGDNDFRYIGAVGMTLQYVKEGYLVGYESAKNPDKG